MVVKRGRSRLRVALDELGYALTELDRWGEGHRVATHDFLARVCQPHWVLRLRAQTHAVTALRRSDPNSAQKQGEGQPVRWTCTFQGLAGGSGRAAFHSVAEATR